MKSPGARAQDHSESFGHNQVTTHFAAQGQELRSQQVKFGQVRYAFEPIKRSARSARGTRMLSPLSASFEAEGLPVGVTIW